MNRQNAIKIAVEHAKKWEGLCCREKYSGASNKYFSSISSLPNNTQIWSYPDGKGFSIGWGSYNKLSDGTPVTANLSITKEKADYELLKEMQDIDNQLYPKINATITEFQYAALLDTAYNAGVGSLSFTSNRAGDTFTSLLTAVNSGQDTTNIFPKVAITDAGTGRVLPTLVNRRKDAANLFSGKYNELYSFYLRNQQTINYAVIGAIIIGLTGYVYYIRKKF